MDRSGKSHGPQEWHSYTLIHVEDPNHNSEGKILLWTSEVKVLVEAVGRGWEGGRGILVLNSRPV